MSNRHCQVCGETIFLHSDEDLDKCVKINQLVDLSEPETE